MIKNDIENKEDQTDRERDIMTLKSMMRNVKNEQIIEELLLAYPECIAEKHQYEEVLNYLKQVEEKPFNEFVIVIALIDPSEEETYEEDIDEEAFLSISGFSAKEDLHFALGFTLWEEWANAVIDIQEGLEVNPAELIAICLYEMTFYGFSQEDIKAELETFESSMVLH